MSAMIKTGRQATQKILKLSTVLTIINQKGIWHNLRQPFVAKYGPSSNISSSVLFKKKKTNKQHMLYGNSISRKMVANMKVYLCFNALRNRGIKKMTAFKSKQNYSIGKFLHVFSDILSISLRSETWHECFSGKSKRLWISLSSCGFGQGWWFYRVC